MRFHMYTSHIHTCPHPHHAYTHVHTHHTHIHHTLMHVHTCITHPHTYICARILIYISYIHTCTSIYIYHISSKKSTHMPIHMQTSTPICMHVYTAHMENQTAEPWFNLGWKASVTGEGPLGIPTRPAQHLLLPVAAPQWLEKAFSGNRPVTHVIGALLLFS